MVIVVWMLACNGKDAELTGSPLGIPLVMDGVTYAGAASIDITPLVTEGWTDLDGDGYFAGSFDDPDGLEPFDDADGDGYFDAVFIGGYGPRRPATGVHDPVYARAMILARDGEYLAITSLDLVGLAHPRIWEARDRLAAEGFDPARLLVNSTHNHQGPDTVGLWGDTLSMTTGVDWAFQDQVTDAIEAAVRDAAAAMEPVELSIGRVRMRDRSPFLNGSYFGGKNPDPRMHGMIHDGRDPVVVSDQLLVLHAQGDGGTVFTLTNWSGHPEVWGSDNTEISSDWVGVAREVIEAQLGGVALHMPESLGGMQSALHGELPLYLDDGTPVFQTCGADAIADPEDTECFGLAEGSDRIDADGDRVPEWAEPDSWAFVNSHGWLIGLAALDALSTAAPLEASPLRVDREPLVVPIDNVSYNLLGQQGIFDIGIENALRDPEVCPEVSSGILGCFAPHTFRLQIGELSMISVPGELLPELAWGLPDDEAWRAEVDDPAARGQGATYFPQQDPD
ncbi:MAG TPA: hypothetical protein ENK18_23865, partial [Deltaproteobacteria bacterium]|nr:hypothetical protein [Deltaproteobacteria bacterium]